MPSFLSRRPFGFVVLAAASVAPLLLGAAKEPDTVRIGNEVKKTVGVLTELQAGDVACYLSLKDDKGVEFQEMGDFSICEKPSLVGKRLRLTYELGNVMAEECQGDPDCTKTRTVPLVMSVKVLGAKGVVKPKQ
jgi:hypothetical protein